LVKERRRGQWVFYSLDGSPYPFFSSILQALPDLQEELKKLELRGRKAGCR
jgi:ArsR family transcriptional regulator